MPVRKLKNGACFVEPGRSGEGRRFALTANFVIEWLYAADVTQAVNGEHELLVIFHDTPGVIEGGYGVAQAPAGSVALLPPGSHAIEIQDSGVAVVLSTSRPDLDPTDAINAGYERNPAVAPVQPYVRQVPLGAPVVQLMADIPPPLGNPRLRFLQSDTMSINMVLYEGERDRRALSPHKHLDIEQGTLALAGSYIHHLRVPWGRNADEWVEDIHLAAGPGSLLRIPPQVIHTTEGVGGGRHVMLDIFAPPREDFRDKGWISNAKDYSLPN